MKMPKIFLYCLILLFFSHVLLVQVLQSYSSTEMIIAWKNFHFISSEKSDFHMDNNLSTIVHELTYVYVDIALSWWDIATNIYELVY